jgi:hypothetical protein
MKLADFSVNKLVMAVIIRIQSILSFPNPFYQR